MRHFPPRAKAGNTSWNQRRDRYTQAKFRLHLLKRDGPVCRLCGTTGVPLQAHHTTTTDGMMLCRDCHKAEDIHAR